MEKQSAARVSHLTVSDDCEKKMKREGRLLRPTSFAFACAPLCALPLTPLPYKETKPGAGVIGMDNSHHPYSDETA